MKGGKIAVYIFFLLLPLVATYFPEIDSPIMNITANRLGMLFCAGFLGIYALKQNLHIKISKLSVSVLIYTIYFFVNNAFKDELNLPGLLNFILIVCFIILVDNIDWHKNDLKTLANILSIVAVVSFIVSLIQLTINPYFYINISDAQALERLQHYAVDDNLFRNQSIFGGVGNAEAGIAFGMLFSYFLFQNFYQVRTKYMVLAAMVFFCGFVIFSKYVWVMLICGTLVFINAKYPHKKYLIYPLSLIFVVALVLIFLEEIQVSTLVQNRVATGTYVGRTETVALFFEKFFFEKPITGYGVASWIYQPFLDLYSHGIHVGFVETMFFHGIIGLLLLCNCLLQYIKRAVKIYRVTANPVFFVFMANYVLINFTAVFVFFGFYGYLLMFAYLGIYFQINVVKNPSVTGRPVQVVSSA